MQNFLGKQLNGQNGPDVKATIVQHSRVKSNDIKVIGMEDIHKAKYSPYFSMDQVGFKIDVSNSSSYWLQKVRERFFGSSWMHQFENPYQTWLKLKYKVPPKLVNSYTDVFWPRNEFQEPIRNENGITAINSKVSLEEMKKIYFDESNWSRAEAGFQNDIFCKNRLPSLWLIVAIITIFKTDMRITTFFRRMWFTLKWQMAIMNIFFALIRGEFVATFLNIFSKLQRHKR